MIRYKPFPLADIAHDHLDGLLPLEIDRAGHRFDGHIPPIQTEDPGFSHGRFDGF
jgi:hypothetical protein